MNPNNTLQVIDEEHCRVLAESLRNYKYSNGRGLMTIHFSSTVNLDSATYATAVHNVTGKKFLKKGLLHGNAQ